jgi:signal transduction histidine kinase
MPQGLPRKLRYAFVMQAVMATFAIVIGMYAAGSVVKNVLTTQRLHAEATDYWAGRARDPAYELPRTSTMNGYFLARGQAEDALPQELRGLRTGVFELPGSSRKVLVEARGEDRLYLTMTFALIDAVIRWTFIVSTLLALAAVYAVTWFTYRRAKRFVVPVNWLAKQVSQWDPRDPDVAAIAPEQIPDSGSEVRQLSGALRGLSGRMRDFVQRERDFTRDASHELRTPLTVIRVATDMLLSDPETSARGARSLARMQRAGRDMEAVIDAFLILARSGDNAPLAEDFDVREIVDHEVEKARMQLAGRPIELAVTVQAAPRLHASPRVLAVMFGNVLDNACTFTERGRVDVVIEADRVLVRDTGVGMSPDTLSKAYEPFYRADQFNPKGKGMGLSIVRRLGDRFGWPVSLESTAGIGTTATIGFAQHLLS